jgi:hypothetical protein
MESRFEFSTDAQSAEYCTKIAHRMMELFSIPKEEAIGRMNRDWKGHRIVGPHDLIYHEDVDEWAKTIYYGKASNWWTNPPNLVPRPFP